MAWAAQLVTASGGNRAAGCVAVCRLRVTTLSAWHLLALVCAAIACLGLAAATVSGQPQLTPLHDMTLASDALLLPTSAWYGRSINGVSFQTDNIVTVDGYQYATWYRARGSSYEDLMLARRDLAGTTWEVFDSGKDLSNGDNNWDAHNVSSIGISGDGRVHVAWDMHNNTLRTMDTATGVATSPVGTWNVGILNAERSSLNAGGSTITDVTYPRYITKPNGDMILTYRTGGSGNGNMNFATYDAGTGLWNAPHQIINGTNPIWYTDPVNSSDNRNAYLNGLSIGPDGDLHVTWTWREEATGGSNHDICYAYSDDGGDTWRNNSGAVIGTVGSPIDLNSPGIVVVAMDRTNTLMNQQAQAVDGDGRVHSVMWHKTDEAPPQTSPPFTTAPAAYFHYFRDPDTGAWTRRDLPTSREVGSRPDMAYDQDDNLYVAYLSPGPGDGTAVLDYYTDGDLIIAGATKASGYTDWSILVTDTRDFASEPFIDQNRLLEDGILSVFVQENDDAVTGRTGTPLHVLEYTIQSTALAGDYNDDGIVNAADYTVWRDNVGEPAGSLPNDIDGVTIGAAQYNTWKTFYGQTSGMIPRGALTVPEPASLVLLLIGTLAAVAPRHTTVVGSL